MLAAMSVAALVLGAGRGTRFRASLAGPAGGVLPKAFVPLAGRSLLARSLSTLAESPGIDRVQPVLAAAGLAAWPEVRREVGQREAIQEPVVGGEERQDSVREGLRALPAGTRHVAVHDAARPLVSRADVARVVTAGVAAGAALLAVPLRDTLKRVDAGGRVLETPSRTGCWAAQTPQVFRVDWLWEALDRAAAEGVQGTDDAELVARLGFPVEIVAGDPQNFKITTREDLRLAEAWIRQEEERPLSIRVGQGFDVHALVPGRPLVLGGVRIPHDRGLAGHSDGDALLHAITDALLGALGEGDLGRHFPSSDESLRGVESGVLLERAVALLATHGARIGNLDATVIAEGPRLAPHQPAMAKALAERLQTEPARINLKVTSTDRLGAIGRGEGIAAQAVVLIEAGEAQ